MAKQVLDPRQVKKADLPPASTGMKGKWLPVLTLLLRRENRGHWCIVQTYDSPEEADNARKNLSSGKVIIPEPTHHWSFASRGCDVYAIYYGPKAPAQVRRKTKKKR